MVEYISTSPTDITDRNITVEKWLKRLRVKYDVDTLKVFPRVHKAFEDAAILEGYIEQLKADWEDDQTARVSQDDVIQTVAHSLADAIPASFEDALLHAGQAVEMKSSSNFETVLKVLIKARDRVRFQIFPLFKQQANKPKSLLALLRPRHDELVAGMIKLADALPVALNTLEDARALGLEAEYTELKRLYSDWDSLHTFIAEWREEGVLVSAGKRGKRGGVEYRPWEFRIEDPTASEISTFPAVWEPIKAAKAIQASAPVLWTVEDIDLTRDDWPAGTPWTAHDLGAQSRAWQHHTKELKQLLEPSRRRAQQARQQTITANLRTAHNNRRA